MTFEWKNPPEKKTQKYKWLKVAQKLRERPNEWAYLGVLNFQSQATIIGKQYNLVTTTRKNADGLYDFYAMSEVSDVTEG